jgi:hypothetical protein
MYQRCALFSNSSDRMSRASGFRLRDELCVSQVIGARPFQELDLGNDPWLHPHTLFNFRLLAPVPIARRPFQVDSRMDISLSPTV